MITTVQAEAVLDFLRNIILSYDRPATREKMVQECRDTLEQCGYPIANGWPSRSTEFREYVEREIQLHALHPKI